MENLTQSELINTIVNLTKKVDQLKMQNDHLREIRIQLASLAVNNNFSSDNCSIEKSLENSLKRSTCPIFEDSINSQSISDDIFSCSNSIIPEYKLINKTEEINESYSYLANDCTDKIFHDVFLKFKNQEAVINESELEIESAVHFWQIDLFVVVFEQIVYNYYCHLYFSNTFYKPSNLCGSIEHCILCLPFYNSIVLMNHLTRISNNINKILPLVEIQCKIISISGAILFKIVPDSFIPKCSVTYFDRKSEEQYLQNFDKVHFIKNVPEQSSCNDEINCLGTNFIRSKLSYLLFYSGKINWKTKITSCFMRLSFQEQSNPLKYFQAFEFQDRSVKSFSLNFENARQFKPPLKTVIKNISNIPKKLNTNRPNKFCKNSSILRRSVSVVDLRTKEFIGNSKNLSGDFSEQIGSKNLLCNNFIYTQSRQLWHEKCKVSFAIISRSIVSDITFYIVCKVLLPLSVNFEFNCENIKTLTQECVDRRKAEIIESQLGMKTKEESDVIIENETLIGSEFIKLNSLNTLESAFFKYNEEKMKNTNIYDLKCLLKTNFPVTIKNQNSKPILNISGLSRTQIQEMIKKNPGVFQKAFHQSRNSNKISDSYSESSSTLIQGSRQLYNSEKSFKKDNSEFKQTLSLCDSFTFENSENDLSIMNSQSELINDNRIKSRSDMSTKSVKAQTSRKQKKTVKKIQVNSVKMRENSNKIKNFDRAQKLNHQKSSLITECESYNKSTPSDQEYQEHKNKIKLAFIKQLSELSKADRFTKINSLRKKAASYILNSKMSYNNWFKESNTTTSAQIKQFLDNEVNEKISNKHYRCEKCCISFKLGTELRQHLRFHNFRKKSCVI